MNYDYTIQPVRKRCEPHEVTEERNIFSGGIRNQKRRCKKLANHNIHHKQRPHTEVGATSSLSLNNITNKLLLEQFSILNFINKKATKNNSNTKGKHQKYPIPSSKIIKITVVPITTETQTSKIVLKRNQIVKNIHKTVSNTNTRIKKNILWPLRCGGENHDIRQTSSANLCKLRWKRNTERDESSLNLIKYTKTIINSLNMDHMERRERVSYDSQDVQISPRNSRKSYKLGCLCNETKINDVLEDMNARKNRVTITGRLGINENDQYILNCAATVNNEPIKTYTAQRNLKSASMDEYENNNGTNKITRATQADINICFTNHKLKNTTVNKNVQCHCRNAKDVATTISECKFKESTERKSPLIVISVYPTKDSDSDLKDLIQINQLQDSQQSDKVECMNLITMSQTMGSAADNKNISRSRERTSSTPPLKAVDKRKVENKILITRSPSPPNKSFNKNKVENRPFRSRSRSPSVKATVRDNSKTRLNQRTSKKSVKSPDRQNRQTKVNKVLPQKDKLSRNPLSLNAAQTSKVYPFKNSSGGIKETSAKNNKIKKAIVDSYTKRIVKGQVTPTTVGTKPKNNESSVTINIDGDNEQYRVLFLQDKLSTDLSIRKTLKTLNKKTPNDMPNKKSYSNENAMQNIGLIAKDKISRKNIEKQLNNSQTIDKATAGFKTRDNVDVRHWREADSTQYKNNSNKDYEPTIKITHKTTKKYVDEDDFSAPIKHYRGDQCCVPHPSLRDQEIRDLLGIKQPRSGKSEFVQEVLPELMGQTLHYKQPIKCERSSSLLSHQVYTSLNETQSNIINNKPPKLVSTCTQYEDSTKNSYKQMVLNRNIQVFLQVDEFTKQKPIILSRKQYEKVKKTIQKKVSNKSSQEKRKLNSSTKCSVISIGEIRKRRKLQIPNAKISRTVQAVHSSIQKQKVEEKGIFEYEHNKPLNTAEKPINGDIRLNVHSRRVVSSTEIRNDSLAHLRHVTFSSSNVKNKPGSLLCLREKACPSIQTIFKGHKKCVTPNLGTSAYSLNTDEEINCSDYKYTPDEKQKKPFLRRLMSCLVMRSNRASDAILPRQCEQQSLMNSFDSYHINTSLGGIELTSSLYDTSASFYSNHTILPITRMKRGFFSSVRGFLTNLRSR